MPLSVVLSPAAVKDLDGLDEQPRAHVIGDIESFAAKPAQDPPRVKKLRGFRPALFRLRSGDFRILFRETTTDLHVYRVIDRKDLERALQRLR